MFGAFVTVENIDDIIGKLNLFHVRGKLAGSLIHWSSFKDFFERTAVRKFLLTIDAEKVNLYFRDEGNLINVELCNFLPTMLDFSHFGIPVFTFFEEKDIHDRLNELE